MTLRHLRSKSTLFLVVLNTGVCFAQYDQDYTGGTLGLRQIDTSKDVGSLPGTHGTTPTGAAVYNIPVEVPIGTNGMQPGLSFSYNSQAGSGLLGMGWSLSGGSVISRVGQDLFHDGEVRPMDLSTNDRFVLDGQRLVLTEGTYGLPGSIYDTENASFSRVELLSLAGNDARFFYFKVLTKDGLTSTYGKYWNEKLIAADGLAVFGWRLSRVEDAYGNYMDYIYEENTTAGAFESNLLEIRYSGHELTNLAPYNRVTFAYQARNDAATQYLAGVAFRQSKLLQKVNVYSGTTVVRSYELRYSWRDGRASYLNEVTLLGADGVRSFNATRFAYGSTPPSDHGEWTIELVQPGTFDVYTGDFDGNGKSDLLIAEVAYQLGYRFHDRIKVTLNGDTDPQWDWSYDLPGYSTIEIYNGTWRGLTMSDYNGDGRDDILINTIQHDPFALVQSPAIAEWERPDGQGAWQFVSFDILISTCNTQTSFAPPTTYVAPIALSYFKNPARFMELGDFDADGKAEAVVIFNDLNVALNCTPYLFDENGWQALSPGTNMAALSTLDKMLAGDQQGDGRHELMLFRDQGSSETFHALNILPDHSIVQAATGWFSHSFQADDFRIWPGDFNGDRVTDYLAQTPTGWKTLTGRARLSDTEQAFIPEDFDLGSSYTANDPVLIVDADGNGMSDVIHIYVAQGVRMMRVSYAYGNDANGPLFHAPPAFTTTNGGTDLTVGDINGDGRQDLIGSNDQTPVLSITSFNTGAFERLLAHVSDGYCGQVRLAYRVNNLSDHVLLTYPLCSPGIPLDVVQAIYVENSNTLQTTTYDFWAPRMHLAGRGFLGFMRSYENTLGISSTTVERSVTGPHYTPLLTDKELRQGGILVSRTHSAYEQTTLGSAGQTRVYTKLLSTETTDELSGATKLVRNQWDDHGNIVQINEDVNDDLVRTETNFTYAAYGPAQVPNRVQSTTTTSTRLGEVPVTESAEHEYDGQGGLLQSTAYPGTTQEVRTLLERNAYGAVTKQTTTAPSLPDADRITDIVYDATSRFPMTKTTWWNDNGSLVPLMEQMTYDERWGVVTERTAPDGLTTLHKHDPFGRETEVWIPHVAGTLRHAVYTSLLWAVDASTGEVCMQQTREPGTPTTEVYFDAMGRTLRARAEVNEQNEWSERTWIYDHRGRLISETEPHLSAEDFYTVEREYDDLGLLSRETNSFFGETTHSYAYPGGGQVVHTVTSPSNVVSSTTTDASRVVTTAHDAGGDLFYMYDSRGAQTKVRLNNDVVAVMEYDDAGRQTMLYDQNAGTTRYEYDPFGQLTYMRDAEGHETTYTYDNLGRTLTRTELEGTTTWSYYHQNGRVTNAPVLIEDQNGEIGFAYNDPYLRLTGKTEVIEGVAYEHEYQYDVYDRVTQERFPSGVEVDYTYTEIGQLDEVLYDGNPLFGEGVLDGGLRYTDYRLGNLPITKRNYLHGLPTSLETPGIQHLSLSWLPTTADLKKRWDLIHDRSETFEYDALSRLTHSTVHEVDANGNVVDQIAEHEFAYDGNLGQSRGNLTVKQDIGQLKYVANKPTGAYNINYPIPVNLPPDIISLETQTISYTSYHKTSSITELHNAEPWSLTYRYGPDRQRRVSTLVKNGVQQEKRVYVGNYEKQLVGGDIHELHYIQGGDGLCAILVKAGGNITPYFIFKDHLGSIVTVVKYDGIGWTIAGEQNFDAWGRRRSATTWEYTPLEQLPKWLYRGYTGHEHVEPFALINMNGRMYDPVNGRMMSADPVVASANVSQAFNRYSYAFNNPLKYTDPDGRLPILAIMAFGAIMNAGIQGFTVGFDNPWQFAGALIVGAASSAAGYGAAAGVTSLIGGSAMGFFNGSLVGAVGGAAGGAVYGFGNSWNTGSSFNASLATGWRDAKTGAWTGAITGGIAGGIAARKAGHRFWSGRNVVDKLVVSAPNLPSSQQVGDMDCFPHCVESSGQSLGVDVTAESFRNFADPGSDPYTQGFTFKQVDESWTRMTGRPAEQLDYVSWKEDIVQKMHEGGRVIVGNANLTGGHVRVVEGVYTRSVIRPNGSELRNFLHYRVMDPSTGRFHFTSLRNAWQGLVLY